MSVLPDRSDLTRLHLEAYMSRKFKTPDYGAMLQETVSLGDALPPSHLARFIVEVITQLDLSGIYGRYAPNRR